MSGSWKAALKASASALRPKSQAMYLTRTSPMTRESMAEAIRTKVAVKAVWRCEGRKRKRARCQRGGLEVDTMQDGLILPFERRHELFARSHTCKLPI